MANEKQHVNIADLMRSIKEKNPQDEFVNTVSSMLDIKADLAEGEDQELEKEIAQKPIQETESIEVDTVPEPIQGPVVEQVFESKVAINQPIEEPAFPTYEEVLNEVNVSQELADEIIDGMLFEGEYEHTFTYTMPTRSKEIKIILGAFGGDKNVKETNAKMSALIDDGVINDDNYLFYLDKCNLAHSIKQIGLVDLRDKDFDERYSSLDKRPGHVINSWSYLLGRYSEMVHAVMNHPEVIQNF